MKCSRCGASLNLPASSLLLVRCPYCNSTLDTTQELRNTISVSLEKEHLIGISLYDAQSATARVRSWLDSLRHLPEHGIALDIAECEYHPFWVIQCVMSTTWRGRESFILTTSRGEHPKTETRYRVVSGQFSQQHSIPIIARAGNEPPWCDALYEGRTWLTRRWAGSTGLRAMWAKLWHTGSEKRKETLDLLLNTAPLSEERVPKQGLSRPNVTEADARQRVAVFLEGIHFDRAKCQVSELDEVRHSIAYIRSVLVHVPFWITSIHYEGMDYPITLLGSTGQLVHAVVPVI